MSFRNPRACARDIIVIRRRRFESPPLLFLTGMARVAHDTHCIPTRYYRSHCNDIRVGTRLRRVLALLTFPGRFGRALFTRTLPRDRRDFHPLPVLGDTRGRHSVYLTRAVAVCRRSR